MNRSTIKAMFFLFIYGQGMTKDHGYLDFGPTKTPTSRGPKVSVGFSSPSQTAGEQFERSERMAAKQYIHIRVYKLAAPENG